MSYDQLKVIKKNHDIVKDIEVFSRRMDEMISTVMEIEFHSRKHIMVKNEIFEDMILARNQIKERLDSIENEIQQTHQSNASNPRPNDRTRRYSSRSYS